MNEVSCRVLIGLMEMSEAAGISRDELLHGHRHSPEHLLNERNRTDWETAIEMMRRLRQIKGSREAFMEIASTFGRMPSHHFVRHVAAVLFDPSHLFTYPNRVIVRWNLGPHMGWDWRFIKDREMEVFFRSDAAHPSTADFWDFHVTVLAEMPCLLGLPPAEVQLTEWTPGYGKYSIILPPSGTLWARAGRFLRLGTKAENAIGIPAAAGKAATPADEPARRKGNEFSCRVLIGLVEMAEAGGISREKLLCGFRHSPEHIMDPKNRTDWDIGMEMLQRVRREAGSREAFLALAQNFGRTPSYDYLRSFAAMIFDPIHFYTYPQRIVIRLRDGAHANWEWKMLGSRQVEGVHSTDAEHPAPIELWEFNAVCFSKLPNLIGLPDAKVEMLEYDEHHVAYRIVPPPSGTLWARAWRFLRLGKTACENTATARHTGGDIFSSEMNFADTNGPLAPQSEADRPPAPAVATRMGNELSCRILVGVVEMGESIGIPRERLLNGFRHSPQHIMDARNRTDWDIGMEMVRRLRREAGSREEFHRAISSFGQTPSYRYLRLFAAAVFDPVHLYTYPNRAISKMNAGAFVEWEWKMIGRREMEGILRTDPAHPAPEELWDMHVPIYAKMPSFLGLPDAVAELRDWSPHHGRYRILLPPSKTLWARAGRFLRAHGPSPDPVFSIFAQQHEDLRRSYEVLNDTERDRAELARELLRVADREREQFAREIHDGLGQELFALKVQADVLSELDGEELKARVRDLGDLAGRAQQMARSLARSYDPIVGAGGHFSDAVRMLAARYEGNPAFDLEGLQDVALDAQKATQLYRIVQEAVTNALRHGAATRVHIAVERKDAGWQLVVEDNGRSCDAGAIHKEGMGLRTMRYRAGQLGGSLNLESLAQGGTRVVCAFLTTMSALL